MLVKYFKNITSQACAEEEDYKEEVYMICLLTLLLDNDVQCGKKNVIVSLRGIIVDGKRNVISDLNYAIFIK